MRENGCSGKLCPMQVGSVDNCKLTKEQCPYFTQDVDYQAILQVIRSELAREIFEEIEIEIVAALRSNYSAKQERVEKQIPDDFVSHMCEGKIAALRGIADFIAELKKKYAEDE